MIKQLKPFALALILFSAISCGSDDPNPIPGVDIKTPQDNQEFKRGGDLPLDAIFTDDKALKSCTVTLSFKSPKSASALKGISDPWQPEPAIIKLNGTTRDEKKLENIFTTGIEAACESGNYALTFIVEDHDGNKSEPKIVNIVIN